MPRYYSDPKKPDCPRAGWECFIRVMCTENRTSKDARNRYWRTAAELDEIVTAVLARNKYVAAKRKVIKARKGRRRKTEITQRRHIERKNERNIEI